MTKTIQNGINARRDRGGVLGGRWVYICHGVAGNQAPSAKELRLIIEAAGGTLLSSLGSHDFDPGKTIILTSDPRTQSQLNESGVKEQVDNGAKTCTTSWLFHSIITQTLVGFDPDQSPKRLHDSPSKVKSPQVSDLVRCHSPESLMSTLTATPIKRLNRKRNAIRASDGSVCSSASRGSKVSHLEHVDDASSPKKRMRKVVGANQSPKPAAQKCTNFLSKEQFLSEFSPSTEPFTKDTAIIKLHTLWVNYFQQSRSGTATPKLPRVGKGVRCRRGRKRTLSPLVTCTSNAEVAPIPTTTTPRLQKKRNSKLPNPPSLSKALPEHHGHVSWEAYVLFTLELRAKELGGNKQSMPGASSAAESYFPKPVSIGHSEKTLSLTVNCIESIERNQDKNSQQIFGTLQDVFDLHRQHQFGPIPESVLARLAVLAIQAVCAMHACGVVHNDITLDSFLISKAALSDKNGEDEWRLQLVGFGYKSVVLNCQEETEGVSCKVDHFEHDYKCLANVVHLLLTGGMPIALTREFGRLEFTSKEFLKGNLFLRGALSWCALIDALLCTGDDFDPSPIRLEHPLDIFGVEESESYPKCRKSQISWASRMLFEISTTNMSVSSFLKGLCRYNSRFTLPTGPSREFSYSPNSVRQSFIICQPTKLAAATSKATQSEPENAGDGGLQNRLRTRECAIARREAMFHKEHSLIETKLQESKTMHNSNIATQQSLQKKEADLLRKEEGIEAELNHIQKMKEDLLAREQLLELRIQRMSSKHDSPSGRESHDGYNSSPCHSTQGRSSVCSSVDVSRNKRRKKTKDRSSLHHLKQSDDIAESPTSHTSLYNIMQSSVPRPSEHLCSLQNLGSPATKNIRGTSTPGKPRRTPKKVFIDMDMDD